jgi:hypothetical protein
MNRDAIKTPKAPLNICKYVLEAPDLEVGDGLAPVPVPFPLIFPVPLSDFEVDGMETKVAWPLWNRTVTPLLGTPDADSANMNQLPGGAMFPFGGIRTMAVVALEKRMMGSINLWSVFVEWVTVE